MKVNNRFSIERDNYNFIVVETIPTQFIYGRAKPKNPFQSRSYYFPSLSQACSWILAKEVEIETVETVLASIGRAKTEILDAIKDFTEEK